MSLSPSAAPSDAAFDFEQLAPPPRAERPPSMDEAHDGARAIIAAAGAPAESLPGHGRRAVVAAAGARAGSFREHARREGYAEGMVAGRAALRQIGEPAVQALSEAADRVREFEAEAAD